MTISGSTTAPLALTVLAALAAAPADAAQEWHPGTIEHSTVSNCNFDPETGIVANAEFQSDPASVPKVGDVFYVRTIPGRVGNGCGSNMSVHVEIVAPAGVAPAVSASNPVRCNYMDIDTGILTPASGCPQAAKAGVYGVAFDQLTPGGSAETSPWSLPYGKALVIEIPLRSSRGLAGASPSCSRANGQPPCPASQAGDSLQFADKVIDGFGSPWLSPYVGLFVNGSAGGGAPRVTGLRLGLRRFRAAVRGGSIASPQGTRVKYALSEAATTTFTVERALPGRKLGRRCVAPNSRNRRARRCTRYSRVRGSFRHNGRAGANSFRFTGRVGGRALRPGAYRLVAVAKDAAGNRSQPARTSFQIVRR
jgi:hypothetical protein